MWTFNCYNSTFGRDVIDEWYEGLDGDVQGEIDSTLESLQYIERFRWIRPDFDCLHGGQCKDLCEIRISVKSGKYRLLGFFGVQRHHFTLLVGFKKGRNSDTDKACRVAQGRKKEIEADATRAKECHFP